MNKRKEDITSAVDSIASAKSAAEFPTTPAMALRTASNRFVMNPNKPALRTKEPACSIDTICLIFQGFSEIRGRIQKACILISRYRRRGISCFAEPRYKNKPHRLFVPLYYRCRTSRFDSLHSRILDFPND